jgi:hypothetical protein
MVNDDLFFSLIDGTHLPYCVLPNWLFLISRHLLNSNSDFTPPRSGDIFFYGKLVKNIHNAVTKGQMVKKRINRPHQSVAFHFIKNF